MDAKAQIESHHGKIIKTLLPISHIFKLTGIYPVNLKNVHRLDQMTWSKRAYALSCATITLLAIWTVWGFANDMIAATFLTLGFRGSIDFSIASFHICDVVLSGVYFVVSAPYKCKQMSVALGKLAEIDAMRIPANPATKSIAFTGSVLIFLLALYVLDLFMWGNNSWTGFNNYAAYYALYTVGIMQEVQFWHLMTLLRRRVVAFNANIQRVPVMTLGRVYDALCDVSDAINVGFGFSLSVSVFSCYVNLVICPYVLFVMMSSNAINILNYVFLLWIALTLFRLTLILNVCHSCVNESRKSLGLVFRLIVSKQSKSVENQLKVLVLQMTRRRFQFSAYGLPKINRQLVLSVIGSISSNWMILMQFSTRLN